MLRLPVLPQMSRALTVLLLPPQRITGLSAWLAGHSIEQLRPPERLAIWQTCLILCLNQMQICYRLKIW